MVVPLKLQKIFGKRLKFNEPMAKWTSFAIGGPGDVFVEVENREELKIALSVNPHFIIGNGTNLLVSDRGIRGIVIKLAGEFCKFSFAGNRVIAGAGVNLGQLISHIFHRGLSGLEFAVGIPGTVGGAISTNAGVKNDEISETVEEVEFFPTSAGESENLEPVTLKKSQLSFAYRKGNIPEGWVILKVTFGLQQKEGIVKTVFDFSTSRRKTQPAGSRNAGSVFLNPPNDFAGRLIEKAGLKGLQIGDARVSLVHANFIENAGKATANDVLELMEKIKTVVQEKFGVELQPEIEFVGEK